MSAARKRGWTEVHQAHRFDYEVTVTTHDDRTFTGPVTMISNQSFEVQANGMRTTFFWEGVVAGVELLDAETLAAGALPSNDQPNGDINA